MLGILFNHYPDEVSLSWFIRYHLCSGNRSWRYSSEELFGKTEHNPNILYALHLEFLCSQIPSEFEINPYYIIQKMTVFPFFEPFMPKERVDRVKKSMVDDEDKHNTVYHKIEPYVGGVFRFNGKRIIKICKACIEDDIKDYEEAYLHRIHQIPGNFLCLKHQTPLSYFSVLGDKNNLTIDLSALLENNLTSFKIEPNLAKHFISIGEDIDFVVNGGLSAFSLDSVRQRYRERLLEEAYVLTGRIKQKKVVSDFKQFYPVDFLKTLESNIEDGRKNWIQFILTDSKKFVHPVRHLLFIRFLFGSIKEFVNYSGEYKPFGDAPFPCLNPVADHYKQNVINGCTIKRLGSITTPVGIFKCDCGFSYSRQGPDETENDRFKCGKVLEFGHVWDNKLKNLVEKTSNIAYIAKEMKCYRNTIIRRASTLGIVDKLSTKQRLETKEIGKKISDEELGVYKEEILQYLFENPETTREQLKKALLKQYMLLWIREKVWLEEVLPKPFKDGSGFKVDYKDKDWESRDEELIKKIKQVVSQILLEEKPRRITRTHIAHKINYYAIINKKFMKRMTKTEKYLLSCCETLEVFRDRKVRMEENKEMNHYS